MKLFKKIKIYNLKKKFGFIGKHTFLPLDFDYQSPKCIFIGNYSTFGKGTQLNAICHYDKGKQYDLNPVIKIGNNVWCTGCLIVWCAGEVLIGDNTMIADGCTIIDCNHGIDASFNDYVHQPITFSSVKIGSGCWIGANVTFLPSSCIGDHVIVGAGSIVTKQFPDYCMIAGNPAKIIKTFNLKKKEWEKYERS